MAWTIVGGGAAHAVSGNADGTTGPFRAPHSGGVNTTGADLYLVAASYYSTAAGDPSSGDLADASGNSYTRLTPQAATGDNKMKVVWFYKVSPTTNASEHWTLTDVGNHTDFGGIAAIAFSGTNATPNVRSISSGTTSTTPSAGSIGASGDLVVTAVADYAPAVSSIDSSFSIVDQSTYTNGDNIGIATAWQNLSGGVSGSVNPTWTLVSSPTASSVMAVAVAGTGGGSSGTNWGPWQLSDAWNRIVQ